MSDQLTPRLRNLQRRLASHATEKTKRWWEAYLKGTVPFRGVKMAETRKAVHDWWRSNAVALDESAQRNLAFSLLEQRYAEDKLAGILLLQEILIPRQRIRYRRDLPRIARLFDEGYIADWNTCDWLCVKVLHTMVVCYGERCARTIGTWHRSENLWRRRASAVTFVNTARRGEENFPGYTSMVLRACGALLRDSQRFAQTGAAWTLRELSLADRQIVVEFTEKHVGICSREAIRSITEKMPSHLRRRLLALHTQTIHAA